MYRIPEFVIFLPLWPVLLMFGFTTAWRWYRFKPLAPGECPTCRYDAAGLDACPECGSPIAREQSPA